MDKLDLTHTGGFPLRQDRLAFMQESIRLAIGHLGNGVQALVSYDPSQQPQFVDGYVIYGCKITNNGDGTATVAAGAVFLNNQVYQVDDHTITLSTSANRWYYFMEEITDDPAGVKEYFDGLSHPTQKIIRAKLSFSNYGDGVAQLADLMNVLNNYLYVPESGGSFDPITFMECISPAPRNITRLNGWEDATGHLKVQRDLNGAVTVSISLNLDGESISSGIIGVLPVGYRPATRQRILSDINSLGVRYYIGILTDGTIQQEDLAGTPILTNVIHGITHTYFIQLT